MFRMLFKDLRISPLRTFLTGLSMFVGIVAVILSVLSGTIGDAYLKATNEQLYGRTPTIYFHADEISGGNYADIEKFNKVLRGKFPEASIHYFPKSNFALTLVKNIEDGETNADLLTKVKNLGTVETAFVTPEYNKVFNLPIVTGRWLTENENLRLEVVVNKAAYNIFNAPEMGLLTRSDRLNISKVNLVGVVNDGLDEPKAYINAETIAYYWSNAWETQRAIVYLWNHKNNNLETLQSAVQDIMYDSVGGYISGTSKSQPAEAYKNVTMAIQLAFAISAALLLLVSCLGLINIGLATIEQRSRELLIRRALGATKLSISMLVVGGSLFLALLVAIFAIIVTHLITLAIPFILPVDSPVTPPGFPLEATLISILIALITALIGSLAPAIRASKLEPALALR